MMIGEKLLYIINNLVVMKIGVTGVKLLIDIVQCGIVLIKKLGITRVLI